MNEKYKILRKIKSRIIYVKIYRGAETKKSADKIVAYLKKKKKKTRGLLSVLLFVGNRVNVTIMLSNTAL